MTLRKEYKEHDYLINKYGSFKEAKNDKGHVDERRYAGTLKSTARGTLIMGIWSLIKSFMGMLGENASAFKASGDPALIAIFGSVVVFAVVFVIGISLRFIICRGACREAASGKKKNGYIVCAIMLLTYGVYAVAYFIYQVFSKNADAQDILKFVFDVTSFVILCELIASAYRLRKVRDELEDSEPGGSL